jgi:hypothetical protein
MRFALVYIDLTMPGPFLRELFKTIEIQACGQVIILIPTRPLSVRVSQPQPYSKK